MLLGLKIGLASLIVAVATAATTTPLQQPIKRVVEVPIAQSVPTSTVGLIGYFGAIYDVSSTTQHQIYVTIVRESGDNQDKHNPTDPYGGAWGIAQFLSPTFYHYAPMAGIKDPDIHNRVQQIQTMVYMFSKGEMGQWTEWRKAFKPTD